MADISVIKLPSGNEYNIKDAVARQAIAGGISFNIVWKQGDYESTTAPTATQLASIPQGVTVYYNNGASTATGTLVATEETTGFYLIYSKTQTSEGAFDKYDEYVAVATGDGQGYSWEKLGDTQIDLSGVVTNVTLNKSTDTVIGTDATFTVTLNPNTIQPGTQVAIPVELSNTGSEVAVDYTVGIKYAAGSETIANLDFCLVSTPNGECAAAKTIGAANGTYTNAYSGTLAVGAAAKTETIYITWPYGDADSAVQDTADMNKTVTLSIEVKGQQADPR